jgi:hypothetical protein
MPRLLRWYCFLEAHPEVLLIVILKGEECRMKVK